MTKFRTREDVIDRAEEHLSSAYRSIARTFEEGCVEFLGGFSSIIKGYPGWIIRLYHPEYKKIYYVAVVQFSFKEPAVIVLNAVKWENWNGNNSDNPLYQGDDPEKYRRLKNASKKQ